MPFGIRSEPFKERKPLLPALVGSDAGMGLVDHDQLRTGPRKTVAAPVGLDVVEANDSERIGVEDGLRCR